MSSSKSIKSKFKEGDYFKYNNCLIGKVIGIKEERNPLTHKISILVRYDALLGGEDRNQWFFYMEGSIYINSIIITKEEAFLELL